MPRRVLSAFLLLPLIAISAALLVACGDDDNDNGGASASPTRPAAAAASPTAAASSPTAAAGGGANNITIADFSYAPARLNARAGQQLQLTVTNSGQFPHTFTIANVTDSGSMAAGQTRTVTFTPATAGTLTYFCTIHGEARMSGQIIVAGTTGALPSDGGPAGGQTTSGTGAGSGSPDSSPAGYDYGY